MSISLLDCTLRDGGYINDWEFGHNNLISIYERLVASGTEIVEVGFIDDRRPFDINRSIFPDTESIKKIYGNIRKKAPMTIAMIDYGTCDIKKIQPCSESWIDGIRVIFKKHLMHEAMDYCAKLKALGYKVFSQLVSITSYNDQDVKDISDLVANCGFGVFTGALENGGSVRGINANGQGAMPRKKIDALVNFAKDFGAKGLAYLAIAEDGSYKSSFAKFMTEEELTAIVERMEGKPGDLLFFAADKNKVVWDVLGNLRLEIARNLELLDKKKFNFLWVTEFPLLEWSEEQERYVAMHHPFTMPMEEDLDKLDSAPGEVRAKAYDIVLNGTEIGGGSVRIFQSDIQSKMFEILGFTPEEAEERFGFLLNAFKYGVPPHAGLAYGFDRLIMLMAGVDSIREVIAFPKVKDASCLMSNAPDVVEEKQLEELKIAIACKEEIEE